jgi:hypothetical protein
LGGLDGGGDRDRTCDPSIRISTDKLKLINQPVLRGLVQRVASRRDACPRGGPSDFICADVKHDEFSPSLAGKPISFPSCRALSLSRFRGLHALNIVSHARTGNFLPDLFFIFFGS